MNIVSTIHRFLGETLLLIALIGVVLATIGLVRKKQMAKAENVFGIAYSWPAGPAGASGHRAVHLHPDYDRPVPGRVDLYSAPNPHAPCRGCCPCQPLAA